MPKIQSFIYRIKHLFNLSTPAAIILGALLISLSHIVYGVITSNQTTTPATYFSGRTIDDTDYVEGTNKQDVYVVEYSDPECPFCVAYYPSLKKIRDEYNDKVAFVYRHFPLTQLHEHAFEESKAIACAGMLGGTKTFYEYIDKIYGYKANTSQTQLPKNGKEDIAKGIGLDPLAFTSCMNSEKASSTINDSMSDGVQAGVEGTPTTFVLKKTRKGYEVIATIVGARTYEYTKAAIEQALSK